MSRIIAAIVLVLLMIGLCISDRFVINNAYNKLYEKVVICERTADTSNSVSTAEELSKEFNKTEGLLSVYVNHDVLDEIAESTARLKAVADISEVDYLSECAFIKLKLQYIKKDLGVSLHSIF